MSRERSGSRLYREGLRRLQVPGVVALLVVALLNVSRLGTRQWASLFFFELYLLPLPRYVLPVLFVFWTFSFLNKREGSDFHFALPCRRTTLYVSFFAAAMTWTLAAVVTETVFSCIGKMALHDGIPLIELVLESLRDLLSQCATVLFVSGAATLAVCVTGTRLANAGAFLVTLLLPSLMVGTFMTVVHSRLPVLYFAEPDYSLDFDLWRFLLWRFLFSQSYGLLHDVRSMLTAAVGGGVLYMLLGGVAFARRRAEDAGHPAPGKWTQLAVRVGLAMLPGTLACVAWINRQWQSGALLTLLSLLVYFLYELLTTRRFGALKRALPGVLALLVLVGAFFGGFELFRMHARQFRPTAEEITSVRFVDMGRLFDRGYVNRHDYVRDELEGLHFDAPEIRELVSTGLASAVESCAVEVAPLDWRVSSASSWFPVAITCDGRTVTRRIHLGRSQCELLQKQVAQDERVAHLLTTLPAWEELSMFSIVFDKPDGGLRLEEGEELYQILQDELSSLSSDDRQRLIDSRNSEITSSFRVEFLKQNGDSTLFGMLPLTDCLPKTRKASIELLPEMGDLSYAGMAPHERAICWLRDPDLLKAGDRIELFVKLDATTSERYTVAVEDPARRMRLATLLESADPISMPNSSDLLPDRSLRLTLTRDTGADGLEGFDVAYSIDDAFLTALREEMAE